MLERVNFKMDDKAKDELLSVGNSVGVVSRSAALTLQTFLVQEKSKLRLRYRTYMSMKDTVVKDSK